MSYYIGKICVAEVKLIDNDIVISGSVAQEIFKLKIPRIHFDDIIREKVFEVIRAKISKLQEALPDEQTNIRRVKAPWNTPITLEEEVKEDED